MFGYLRPDKDELKIKDYRAYKSVYCGLCRCLAKDYGILASLTLSYDCTVLAMLYMSVKNEQFEFTKGRCTVNPLKKCMICRSEGEAFHFAGAVSVIMSCYKMNDTISDGGFLKKAAAAFIRSLLYFSYKKARKAYPEIDRYTSEMMLAQAQAEKSNAGVDISAEPTAELIKKLCVLISPSKEQNRILGVFGYYVGRWIYLMDAADDLEKDIRHKSFNPFAQIYDDDIRKTMDYCNEVLNMTAAQIVLSYELIELHSFQAILDNIVNDGLTFQQKKYLEDKYSKKKDQHK